MGTVPTAGVGPSVQALGLSVFGNARRLPVGSSSKSQTQEGAAGFRGVGVHVITSGNGRWQRHTGK